MNYETLDIFDFICDGCYKINNPIRLIELFAGIGSQAKALERLGVEFEHYKIAEWEVNAFNSYNAVHMNDNTDYSQGMNNDDLTNYLFNIGISNDGKKPMKLSEIKRKDIDWKRKAYNSIQATHNLVNIASTHAKDLAIVDTDKFTYILTYSFPCQDLSLAGKRKGMAKGSGTRSGMLWEVERILDECEELPQILLMENVPQVIGDENKEHFDQWVFKLETLGYSNYWKILNAKDYGIPQNRQRCFMVSMLGEWNYKFPKPMQLELKLKDLLEDDVDEKYYISDKRLQGMINTSFNSYKLENRLLDKNGISSTILARFEGAHQCVEVEPLSCAMRGRYDDDGNINQHVEVNYTSSCNAITTVQKDSMILESIKIPEKNEKRICRSNRR